MGLVPHPKTPAPHPLKRPLRGTFYQPDRRAEPWDGPPWANDIGPPTTTPHCHLLISERTNDGLERSPEQWFRRYNAAAPAQGGARKTEALKPKAWLEETRAAWAAQANQALEQAGHAIRIDHRRLEAQGLARLPSLHLGPTVQAMEARGIETERGAEARRRARVNAELRGLAGAKEELEDERARPDPEREPGRAGAEREGGDVGGRAGRLAARDGGERGPGLGNGGRASRGAEPAGGGGGVLAAMQRELAALSELTAQQGQQHAALGRLIERQEQALVPGGRAMILGLLVGLLVGVGGATLYQAFGPSAQELTTYRGMWAVMTPEEREEVNQRIRGEDAGK